MAPTVHVKSLDAYPAYAMIWQAQARRQDIEAALDRLVEELDTADHPHYVVVDLRSAADFSLGKTIASVLVRVYVHSNLEALLLCGPVDVTRTLKRTLDLRTGLSNSHRFKAWSAVIAYLDEQTA